MLLELREDRFYTHGWGAVLSNEFDAIDEQEEQARAEVRLTGELFAFPTGEAFCDMVGYSPPVGPYRTPKGERVSPFRGDIRGRGDSNFKKTRPIPGYPKRRDTPPPRAFGKQPKAPLWGLREPTQKPIFQYLYNIDIGDEFTVIWPGNAANERVFLCIERSMIMFNSGEEKEAVVFDYYGREMRIEARACWPLHVFNALNKEPGK